MKLLNQSVKFITEENPLKCIELAGKVTHKSEGNITEDSYKKFIINMLKVGHTATLEFGNVYIETDNYNFVYEYDWDRLVSSPSSTIYLQTNRKGYRIYTNLRVLLNKCPELFIDYIEDTLKLSHKFIPEANDPYRRLTYHITTNRGISHELVRHRVFSFMQESTRYCNYSNDKFGNELNVINPFNNFIQTDESTKQYYNELLGIIEEDYNSVIGMGLKAQEARGILPNDLKTEVYMSGYLKDWIGHKTETSQITLFGEDIDVKYHAGFDTLRRDKAAHPQAREIAEMIFEDIIFQIGSTEFNKIKESYYE